MHNDEHIDLVIRHSQSSDSSESEYVAEGGPSEAVFSGTGKSVEEAIGSYFIQNREVLGFKFSTIKADKFLLSTHYGRGRDDSKLGPNEQAAHQQFLKSRTEIEISNTRNTDHLPDWMPGVLKAWGKFIRACTLAKCDQVLKAEIESITKKLRGFI
jgi:hypothetical protein